MVRTLLTSLVICMLLSVAPVFAVDGVRCGLDISQFDPVRDEFVTLYSDTADFLKDIRVNGFAVGISLDVEVKEVDSAGARLEVHAQTFAPQPDRAARSFRVEYGLPARLDELTGKNSSRYRLTISPLERVEVDTAYCPYLHYAVDDFSVDPTAHTNIYYVPQTLGDFHWNAIKGLFEEEYDNFNRMANFSMPGKYLLYLCPCRLNTVLWDDRFGMMVDPVRSSMFAIYTRDYNSAYPFLVSQAATYHNYGYAPAFISEGFANYLSFAIFDMKRLLAEGDLPPLEQLLDTYSYYHTDPRTADRMSATFIRYLIDKYGIGQFLIWYRQSDDLNQLQLLESNYQKSVAELEAEWLNYVDTVSIQYSQAGYHAIQAETMFRYGDMEDYARAMLRLATNRYDSIEAMTHLSRANFFQGDYYGATDYQVALLDLVDTVAVEWMKLGGYRMMNGEYEQAAADLARATELDSTNQIIGFNRALNSLYQGDTTGAMQIFRSIVQSGAPDARLESQVMLADLLAVSGDEAEKTAALSMYHEVVGALSRQDQHHNASAGQAMWLGIAYVGIDDIGNADDWLRTALFLETRPFYEGMINLWLGKVADLRGERAVAREYYGKVLSGSSADYHQSEARRLSQSPYRR